jgi:hypothetical protein
MKGKYKLSTSPTPEKFQHLTEEIIDFLIPKLQQLDTLEQEIYNRHQILQSPRISSNQEHPDEEGLWDEYFQRCKEILAPIILKHYTDTRSFGNPPQYDYLNDVNTTITLTIKSESRAVIEAVFERGIAKKEQFILIKDDDSWKIDAKKYGFPDEKTWHKDEL